MNLQDFVASKLTDGERRQIVDDYVQFETEGSIGDAVLRIKAREYSNLIGAHNTLITTWMQMLAFEVYRYYANTYLAVLKHITSATAERSSP